MNDNEWGTLYLVPTPIGNLEDKDVSICSVFWVR